MLETQLTCVPLSSGVSEMKSGRATSRVQRELWCWAVVYFPKQICPNSNTIQLALSAENLSTMPLITAW